jgi:hypothetical protein
LFVDRARLVLAGYQVTDDNAIHLARICQRLDGIPLAVEMAAARMNLLNAEQLADRLDDAFLMLTSGSRTALPRQQTLRATIDWSYALLSPSERWLLQRLSAFAGCTLESVEAVCPVDGEGTAALDVLASLVAKSMAQADRRQGDEARYRLLQVIRQYAEEKLQEAGGDPGLAGRHCAYHLTLAETAVLKLRSSERPAWTRKIQTELENLRQAAGWSLGSQANIESGLRLVVAMNGLWPSHQENVDWPKRAIAACQGRADLPARLFSTVLGMAARWAAPFDMQAAAEWASQAVQISRAQGPTGRQALMDDLFSQGLIGLMGAVRLDDAEMLLEPFTEVEGILEELGSDRLAGEQYLSTMASIALLRAVTSLNQGQFESARLQAGKSIRLFEQARNPWGTYLSHICAGSALLKLGDDNRAREQFMNALRLADETGNPVRKAHVRSLLESLHPA